MVDPSVGLASRKHHAGLTRLKTVSKDPLEELGLPSKGDIRLLDFDTQDRYFKNLADRYGAYRAIRVPDHDFDKAFARMTMEGLSSSECPSVPPNGLKRFNSSAEERTDSIEMSTIMSAMRKLREGIVASARRDDFTKRAYIFMVLAAILTGSVESYYPALLHLMRKIHPVTALSASELHQFVGYYILHLASHEDDMISAYSVRNMYRYKDDQVDQILRAMVSGNWYTYRKISIAMDQYQRPLLRMADKRMRLHALHCIGKSYFSVDVAYLETATGSDWTSLKEKEQLNWDREGENVVIRRLKR